MYLLKRLRGRQINSIKIFAGEILSVILQNSGKFIKGFVIIGPMKIYFLIKIEKMKIERRSERRMESIFY